MKALGTGQDLFAELGIHIHRISGDAFAIAAAPAIEPLAIALAEIINENGMAVL